MTPDANTLAEQLRANLVRLQQLLTTEERQKYGELVDYAVEDANRLKSQLQQNASSK
jgi:hypothetical protein